MVEQLRLPAGAADLSEWDAVVDAASHPDDAVTIAVVGKYVDHQDAYKSVSYTHLDVYKRQGKGCSLRQISTSGWMPILRNSFTECWVGLVFSSPAAAM